VAPFLLFLLVVGGLVLKGLSEEERAAFFQRALAWLIRVREAITYVPPSCQPFNDALRARTRWTIVTPTIVLANVVIFVGMLFGAGAFSDRNTLLAWGASVGPRTTNGEWWRLLGSMFVHAGLIHLLASVAGTLRAGLVLERFVGPVAFATTYLAAGVLASLASVAAHPVALHYGASGAIFGIYGLLIAALLWSMIRSSELSIPVAVLQQLGPGAAFFLLYTFVTEGLFSPSMIVGLAVGGICGFVLASGVGERKPPPRRVLATISATFGIVIVLAVPLRGVADVTGEIAEVVAIEDQTSHEYDALVDKFKRGRTTTDGLIQQIERIRPSLHAMSVRLNSLDKIPPEHQWLVSAAKEYLQLRDDSWRLRAEGLRTSNMRTLQKADGAERASLEALEPIRPVQHD
jgi:membrane associated rhomboid family serine protease